MIFWLINVLASSSHAIVYTLYFFAGIYSLYQNKKQEKPLSGWKVAVAGATSALFSASAALANYDIFDVYGLFSVAAILIGGFLICWNFLIYASTFSGEGEQNRVKAFEGKYTTRVFLLCFSGIMLLNLGFLFLVEYPGTVTADSMWQINQALGVSRYSNWHPICHTLVIEFLMKLGYAIFGNYNDALGLYTVCQVIFLALTFSYAVTTLYANGISGKTVACVACIYLFAPYNIVYSVTVWKDVVFGGFVLLFVTSLYALTMNVGKHRWAHQLLFLLGCIGFGVMRTNGFYALIASFLLCAFVYRKNWDILGIWVLGIVISWLLINPLPVMLQVVQVDILEALAIPMQQVARVVAEKRDLFDGEAGLIDTVISIESVPDLYLPYLSDPIKDAIRRKDLSYFEEHLFDYLKLWVKLGLRYPMDYIRAWVDQTKGYWNGGYSYWVMTREMYQNSLDLYKTTQDSAVAQLISSVIYRTEKMPVLYLLFSIGHHVWLVVLAFVCNVLRGRREAVYSVPVIMIVGTLIIATPVFSEFRYAYSVFTTFPMILAISLPSGTVWHKGGKTTVDCG